MGSYIFTDMEIDAIGEISNICLGSSASTLSMLVRHTVDITPPKVEIVEKSEYTKNVSSKKVFVKVNYVEGVKGCSILMLEEHDAKAIADLMMGSDGNGDFAKMELGELHISAVSEAMNQMMGAAATAMSVMLERKTDISTPILSIVLSYSCIPITLVRQSVTFSLSRRQKRRKISNKWVQRIERRD